MLFSFPWFLTGSHLINNNNVNNNNVDIYNISSVNSIRQSKHFTKQLYTLHTYYISDKNILLKFEIYIHSLQVQIQNSVVHIIIAGRQKKSHLWSVHFQYLCVISTFPIAVCDQPISNSCVWSAHFLNILLFLNIPYLTCYRLMILKYTNRLTRMIVCLLFFVLKSVYPMSKPGWCLISFRWMKTRRMSYLLLLNELLTCSIFQNSWILMALVLNSVLQLGTWAFSTALFRCISMSWMSVGLHTLN